VSKFREAFDAGRDAVNQRFTNLGMLLDPAGVDRKQERLRAIRKWRFIVVRGFLGWGVPLSLWLILSNLSKDVKSARLLHESIFQYLFRPWIAAFCISGFFGIVVGFLAWRRLHSEVWPGAKLDPESSITRLGSLVDETSNDLKGL
jgi:hypothetical protein